MAKTNTGGYDVRLDNFYSGIVNGYNKVQQTILARQQEEAKQLAREQESLADAYSKVNTKGVQPVDIPEMSNITNAIYDTYYKASKSDSREVKMQARLDIQRDLDRLSNFVEMSKERGKKVSDLGKAYADPRNIGLFSTDFKSKYDRLVNTPTSKLTEEEMSLNTYMSPDTSYFGKTTTSVIEDLFKNAPTVVRTGKNINVAGKSGVEQFQEQELATEAVQQTFTSLYNNDIKYKNTVDYLATQQGITPQQFLENELTSLPTKRSKQIATSFAYKPTASSPEKDYESTYTQRQRDLEGVLNFDREALGQVQATFLSGAKIEYARGKNRITGEEVGDYLIKVTLPPKDSMDRPTVRYVNPKNSDSYTELNSLLNEGSGEKVTSNKARTIKGKTWGKEFTPKVNKTTPKPTTKTVTVSSRSSVLD